MSKYLFCSLLLLAAAGCTININTSPLANQIASDAQSSDVAQQSEPFAPSEAPVTAEAAEPEPVATADAHQCSMPFSVVSLDEVIDHYHFSLEANVPISCSQALTDSVIAAIVGRPVPFAQIASAYRASMAREAKDRKADHQELEGSMWSDCNDEDSRRFTLVGCNSHIATFLSFSSVEVCGAAHGFYSNSYQMFDRSTGQRITRIFRPGTQPANIRSFVIKGLMSYFELKSEAELAEHLDFDISNGSCPLPSHPIVICGDKVIFSYDPYEIACYAAGAPSFEVPISDLRPFLLPELLD